MIYRVVLDDTIDIHTSNIDCMLLNPSIELEMNSAGSFTFTLPPTHPNWDDIKVLKSTIDVYENDEPIFTGRVASIEKNWNNERVVTCEGALAYFNDSIHRQMKWETPLPIAIDPDDQPEDPAEHRQNFLEDILNNHNVFEGDNTNRYIYMGHIYVDPELVTREVDYDKTLDILTRMCIDTNGGYFQIRKDPEDGKLYLDWLKDFTDESSQPASFGLNLLDFNTSLSAEDICTGVLARGATVNDQVVTLNDVELVDKDTYPDMSVDHYTDHDQDILWHREGVDKFGQVVQVHNFSDAQTAWKDQHGQVVASSLFEVARKWLEEKNTKVETIEVEVAELAWLGDGYPQYKLGQIVEVIDSVHMGGESQTTRRLPMYKLSCDLTSGSKKVTLGTPPKKELTQISASNSDSSTLSSTSSSGSSGGSGKGEECKVHDVRVDGTSVVSNKIANISLTGKADVSTVNALAATVATKADAATVNALATAVAGKQDQIEFNTQEAATDTLTRLKADNKVYNLGGGTEVVANPSEAATDDLETIKIGNTVYDISGGGSNTNYGKFKCDVLFDTPTTTSAWANPIDICSEEKAKEYDMIYLITKFVDGSSNGFISNSYLVNSIGQSSDSDWMMGIRSNSRWNNPEGFIFLSFDNSKLKFYTNTGNSSTLYKVYGLKFENKLINRSDIYSEEERMIGRWIDGKPLYQKVVDCGYGPNSSTKEVNLTALNIDNCIQIGGYMCQNTTSFLPIPRVSDRYIADQLAFNYNNSTKMLVITCRDRDMTSIRIMAILKYTKTTDSPDSGVIPEDPMFISDPMIFSEEEQVVGSWTDGKPLYQKTIVKDLTLSSSWQNYYDLTGIDLVNVEIDKLIRDNEPIPLAFSNIGVGSWIKRDGYLKFCVQGSQASEGWVLKAVTIRYTKTTDSILSGPRKGKIVQRSDIYSEEERLVGRWTDGKPLYQKTLFNVSNGDVMMANVDTFVDIIIKRHGYGGNSDYIDIGDGYQTNDFVSPRLTNGVLYYEDWSSTQGGLTKVADSVTIKYTKTTDAPFSKQLIEDPQFVMMSDIYSEEEQVVGRWTDGKPLYQKTGHLVMTGNTNDWTILDNSDIYDYLVESFGTYYEINGTNKDLIAHYDGRSASPRMCVKKDHKLYYYVNDNASGRQYQYDYIIRYTKTTDTPGSGPTKGNLIYLPALYSEEEREVGVWTDGKPLYQKTINFGTLPNNTTKTVSSGLTNVVMHNIFGVAKAPNGFTLTLPHREISGNGNVDIVYQADNYIRLVTDYNYSSFISYITLQYTKTTDQPGSGKYLPDGQYAHHYSTSEKIVGTWIDGSTVYEKVFTGFSVTLQNGQLKDTGASFTNVSTVISCLSITDDNLCTIPVAGYCINNTLQMIGYQNGNVINKCVVRYTKSS